MRLSVVHGIVKGLRGGITLYCDVGKGSTFHVYLPTRKKHGNKGCLRPWTSSGGNERVLPVDDEKIILKIQKEMLTLLGYKVETFSSPKEALQFFIDQPNTCDLVITDMTMRKMTGDELTAKMQQL